MRNPFRKPSMFRAMEKAPLITGMALAIGATALTMYLLQQEKGTRRSALAGLMQNGLDKYDQHVAPHVGDNQSLTRARRAADKLVAMVTPQDKRTAPAPELPPAPLAPDGYTPLAEPSTLEPATPDNISYAPRTFADLQALESRVIV